MYLTVRSMEFFSDHVSCDFILSREFHNLRAPNDLPRGHDFETGYIDEIRQIQRNVQQARHMFGLDGLVIIVELFLCPLLAQGRAIQIGLHAARHQFGNPDRLTNQIAA